MEMAIEETEDIGDIEGLVWRTKVMIWNRPQIKSEKLDDQNDQGQVYFRCKKMHFKNSNAEIQMLHFVFHSKSG